MAEIRALLYYSHIPPSHLFCLKCVHSALLGAYVIEICLLCFRHLFDSIGIVYLLTDVRRSLKQSVLVLSLCSLQSFAFQRHSRTYAQVASKFRLHRCLCYLVVFPCHANLKASACFQSAYGAVFPCVGQGRQQIDKAVMTLHQHLCYAGSAAEVARQSGMAGERQTG